MLFGEGEMKFENLDILKLDRRTFLKVAAAMGASAFLGTYKADIVNALALAETKIVWLHGAECTGCTESFLNAAYPDVVQAITKLNVNVAYHETLLAQQGIFVDGRLVNTAELNSEILLEELVAEGGYVLVVEGAIPNGPDGTGNYCMIGGHSFKEMVRKAAEKAEAIVAMGTCSSYGGVPAANSAIQAITDNRGLAFTGTDSTKGILREVGIDEAVVNIPGCPAHPDWVMLTLASIILGKGVPDLDRYGRPAVFYPDHTIHENCPRRGFYDIGQLDTEFAEGHCLWKLGCKAPVTHADCAIRLWNNTLNMCTQAGSPCIGCVQPGFPDSTTPFYVEIEKVPTLVGVDINTIAKVAVGAAAIGVGAHAVRRIAMKEE